MEKNKVILEIMNLYDEVQTLRNTVIWLKEQLTGKEVTEAVTGLKELTHYEYICNVIKKESEKYLLKDVLCNWKKCWCKFNEETQEYKYQNYENWLDNKIYDSNDIFEKITKNDFIEYFKDELTELYEKEKQEALENEIDRREREEQTDE